MESNPKPSASTPGPESVTGVEGPSPAAPDYKLDGLTVPRDRKGQAAFYGAGEKTIKNWAGIGREAKDPAPFSDPPAMVEWWERLRDKGILKHRVPVKLLDAAARWTQPPSPAAPAPEPAAAELARAGESSTSIDLSQFDADADFTDAANTAKLNCQVHAQLLRLALGGGKEDRIRMAQSAFEKAFETYRVAEGSKTKIMADQGRSVEREDVERKLIQLHAPMPARLRASLLAAYRQLPEPRPPLAIWKESVERAVNEACHDLILSLPAA
jgi:hypothetical protein